MKTLLVVLLTVPAFAMGNRPPTDPATYQDIENTNDAVLDSAQKEQADITAVQAANAQTNATVTANASQEQADNQAVNTEIHKMNETKMLVEGDIRLYDGKRIAVEAFNSYDAHQGHNFALGTRITLKLGSSYEERLLAKQAKEIAALKAMIQGGK